MGRSPCSDENGLKKGPWTPEEDEKLVDYITKNGHGSWRSLPKNAGLKRCGKSCRLRWTNYLRPDIKRGKFSPDEEKMIINLHSVIGNKWSKIATHLPGRTDNEIKNYWNTCLRKKLLQMGIDPNTHKPRTDFNHLLNISQLLGAARFGNSLSPWDNALKLQADTTQLAGLQLLQNLLQVLNTTTTTLPYIESNTTTTSSGLLGCQNLNLFEGLANSSNNNNSTNSTMLQTPLLDPFQSPAVFSPNSWASNEGVCAINYKKSTLEMENHSLPALVSASSAGIWKNKQQIESSNNDDPANYLSTDSPHHSSIFEAWEKIMDDDTNETYWNDILELMS